MVSGSPKTETTSLRSAALARRSHSRALPPTGLQTETSPCPSGALRGVNSIKFLRFCSGSRIQWPTVADTRESQLRPTGPTLAHARANSPTIHLKKGSRDMPGEMLGSKLTGVKELCYTPCTSTLVFCRLAVKGTSAVCWRIRVRVALPVFSLPTTAFSLHSEFMNPIPFPAPHQSSQLVSLAL